MRCTHCGEDATDSPWYFETETFCQPCWEDYCDGKFWDEMGRPKNLPETPTGKDE